MHWVSSEHQAFYEQSPLWMRPEAPLHDGCNLGTLASMEVTIVALMHQGSTWQSLCLIPDAVHVSITRFTA